MRWRNTHFWALGAFGVLAFLLAFGGHPASAVSGGVISAPSAPNACVESASVPWLLQSHFSGSGYASRSVEFVLALRTIRTVEAGSRIAGTIQPHYGPLYRRPPPRFS